MARRLSIAEARDRLPRLIHEAEGGEPVEITRRGEAVAVIIDIATWRRMRPSNPDLLTALEAYWADPGAGAEDLNPDEIFGPARDRAPAPDVDLG